MKNAEEWLDENGYKNTEMWSRQGVYEVAIRLQHDHDNELISEIEKKIKEKTDLQNIELDELDDYKDNQLINDLESEIEALTEIINLIKEK